MPTTCGPPHAARLRTSAKPSRGAHACTAPSVQQAAATAPASLAARNDVQPGSCTQWRRGIEDTEGLLEAVRERYPSAIVDIVDFARNPSITMHDQVCPPPAATAAATAVCCCCCCCCCTQTSQAPTCLGGGGTGRPRPRPAVSQSAGALVSSGRLCLRCCATVSQPAARSRWARR